MIKTHNDHNERIVIAKKWRWRWKVLMAWHRGRYDTQNQVDVFANNWCDDSGDKT